MQNIILALCQCQKTPKFASKKTDQKYVILIMEKHIWF